MLAVLAVVGWGAAVIEVSFLVSSFGADFVPLRVIVGDVRTRSMYVGTLVSGEKCEFLIFDFGGHPEVLVVFLQIRACLFSGSVV
jgi:hypothetical protein